MDLNDWEIRELESFKGGVKVFSELRAFLLSHKINIIAPEDSVVQKIIDIYMIDEKHIWIIEKGIFKFDAKLMQLCRGGYFIADADRIEVAEDLPGQHSSDFFLEFPLERDSSFNYLDINLPEGWGFVRTHYNAGNASVVIMPTDMTIKDLECNKDCCISWLRSRT